MNTTLTVLPAGSPLPTSAPVHIDDDGMAIIRRAVNDFRGIRYVEGEGGNAAATDAGAAQTDATHGASTTGTNESAAGAGAAASDGQTGAAAGGSTEKVEDLPSWAQKIITDTRSEAAKYRTGAQTAAQQAEQALTDKLAVALGLKPDAKVDPAALTASLTQAQQDARTKSIQLAVYKAAGANGANPDALLDSNTFLASVKDLDPSAADFQSQIGGAIKTAVAANTTLKQVRAAAPSTTDNPGGEPGLITEQQLKSMSPEQVEKAFREGKLKHLLT